MVEKTFVIGQDQSQMEAKMKTVWKLGLTPMEMEVIGMTWTAISSQPIIFVRNPFQKMLRKMHGLVLMTLQVHKL